MFAAEKFQALAPEQYGCRKGKVANVQSLNKCLFYDTIRYKRQPAALCSHDAKSCYDRIVLLVMALAMCRLWGNQNWLKYDRYNQQDEALHQNCVWRLNIRPKLQGLESTDSRDRTRQWGQASDMASSKHSPLQYNASRWVLCKYYVLDIFKKHTVGRVCLCR